MRDPSRENPTFFDFNPYPSAAQLRQLFNSSQDIICSINLNGCFVHMNEACRKTLGFSPREMIGQEVAGFLHEEDVEKSAAIIEAVVRGQARQNFEQRYRKKDGSFVTLNWSCYWDAREALMFCIGRNVSERKEKEALQAAYEQMLKQKNKRLNEMLNRIADAFYALDEDWRITYANQQFEQILGLQAEDYLSLRLWEALPSLAGTSIDEQFHYAVRENVSVHFETYIAQYESWYEVNAYPSETGLSVFFRDITERKIAEAERRRTEAEIRKLSQIARETTNAVALVEPDSTICWINNAYTTIFGYSAEEAIGQKHSVLLRGPLSDRSVWKEVKKCFYRGESFKGEMAAYTKTREARWFKMTGQPLFDENGILMQFSIIMTDITERRQAEEALLLSNERFQLAAKTDAIYDWDLLSNHLFWGEGLAENFGYTPEELQMSQWEEALHPEERKSLTADLYQTLCTPSETAWKREYRLRKKNGSWFFVFERGHIVRDEAGRALRMVGVMQNISERKEAEELLHKLSLIATHTEDAVLMTTPDRKITWANEAFTRISGYKPEELVGKTPSALLEGPGTDPATKRHIQRQLKKKIPFQVEVLYYRKNGEPFWSEMSMQPLFDAEGKVTGYFSMKRDISERKRMEAELENERKKTTAAVIAAQEKERSFVSQELHDSVNPVLTTVKLYQDMILADEMNRSAFVDKSKQLLQESINEIRRLCKQLSVPIKGILAFSDSIRELIQSVEATGQFTVQTDINAIEELQVTEELHLSVYRILQEHLTNILKHAAASSVVVMAVVEENNLALQVIDNGRGFNPAQKRTGIGISNMLLRAEHLNGKLTIDSKPGSGCKLTACFPLGE